MLREKDKFSNSHFKELIGIMGSLHLLEGDFENSKILLRNHIRMSSDENYQKALALNNLGVASWLHFNEYS